MMFRRWLISGALALASLVGACVTTTPDGSTPPDAANDTGSVTDAPVGCNADPRICPTGTTCDMVTGRCMVSDSGSMADATVLDTSAPPGCTPGEPRPCSSATCSAGTAYCNVAGNAFGACGCPLVVDAGPADLVPTDASVIDASVPMDVMSPTDVSPTCGSGQTYCGGRCVDTISFGSDPMNCRTCGNMCLARPNARVVTCTMGACGFTCDVGFTDCDGNADNGCEVNTGADGMNCGACARMCSDTQVCTGGRCADRCPGSTFCVATRACVDTQVDTANCGRCGNACSATNGTSACSAGRCTVAACNTGFGDCDSTASNGCETNTNTNDRHCGRCGNACPAGQACSGSGRCVSICPVGQTFCAGSCVDINTDESNCGGCGTVCTGGTVCLARACTGVCPLGRQVCMVAGVIDACVDFASDLRHCGGCGRVCNPFGVNTAQCVSGVCGFNRCSLGLANCDGNDANGCEADLYGTNNCGACGTVCPARTNASSYCSISQTCAFACNTGFGDCDSTASNGCETNTRTSLAHCGACGRACLTGRPHQVSTCLTGACDYACESGFADCDGDPANGCEVDIRTDAANCGRCSTRLRSAACASGQVCSAGVCTSTGPSCGVGTLNCGGVCMNILSDPANCGTCGNRCPAGYICTSGACALSCMTPGSSATTACGGSCVDIRINPAHCGGCGRACAAGQICSSGMCTVSCGAGLTPCNGACVDTQSDPMNCGSCGGRCGVGLVCSRGVCSFPDAGVDATADVTDASTDATADVMSDGGDAGVDVMPDSSVDVADVMPTDVVVTGFGLFIRPASGTAATSPTGGTMSFVTAQRSVLVPRTWLAGGAEATPAASPGGIYNVNMTPGYSVVKYYVGAAEQDLCGECRVNGRCTAAALGYVDGDIRVRGNPYLSPVGEDVNGRIAPVSQVFVRRDPYNPFSTTCALVIGINQPVDATAPGAAP